MADSLPGVDARMLKDCGALLAAEAARFASFGWMRGTSGNLSRVLSREPLRSPPADSTRANLARRT
jgi:methylthioribulose-1-phosphate dehydratase